MATPSDRGDGADSSAGEWSVDQHGAEYAAGYRRAVNDLLADLILCGEEFAREVPGHDEGAADTRRAVRGFVRRFERVAEARIEAPAARGGFVSDGLGI